MCGINGYIKFSSQLNKDEMHCLVHSMNEKIVHRGPDSEGIFADDRCSLGMRRLSIIDLGGGTQPIWNESRSKMIVFNGELYNFHELRNKLKQLGYNFKTDSDTEVVLLAYEEYENDCFDMLEGMFAFAIYDINLSEWTLVRDRAGEKPLYYCYNDSFFAFASELKSLASTGLTKKQINTRALSAYFQLTYIPAPETIYSDVYKLMPGTVMKISAQGRIENFRYWNLEPECLEEYRDFDKCKKDLRDKLFASVERRMISDVPLGAFLSGGFDSSIVVGIMSQLSDSKINTFNIGFNEKEFDESKLAGIVAQRNNTNHTELTLDWNEVIGDIDCILTNVDEPFADSSLIATYAVSKMAKKYVSVVLTGDAGDELFAGYDKYLGNYYRRRYNRVPQIIRKGLIEPASVLLPRDMAITRKIRKVIKTASMADYERIIWLMSLGFKADEITKLIRNTDESALSFIKDELNQCLEYDIQTATQYVDFNTVLEGDMLAKVDRASMLASLETRVPMLDRNVVELAFSIPTEYKINGKNRKIILKETFRDLLPDELFSAPKHGFGVPIGKWLETNLKSRLDKYSSKEFINEQGVFDYEYVQKIINEHLSHKANRASEIWTFFVFQNWYEREIIGG